MNFEKLIQIMKHKYEANKANYNRAFEHRFGVDYGQHLPCHQRVESDKKWQRYWDGHNDSNLE